ncbi:hypothetical protein M569_06091 [Genlisea aurea]|uniref:Replication protein A subunit n=1 Tax=Genlisea aurea TaxID=192259 RepID=S8CUV6_9LAMI|nr:hypothetical protein M569_06091 [Genlisea aurea]
MPPVNLTEGAIAALSGGNAQGTDIKPVLQIAEIRLVNAQNQSNNERYRLLLSDGSFTQQGMLATQRNDLVRSQKLQKGSIVQLTQFVCNLIQNRMIIIIIDLDVIVERCDPIGEPKPYPIKPDGNASSLPSPQTVNQPSAGNVNPHSSYVGVSPSSVSAPRPPNVGGINRGSDSWEGRNAHSHDASFSSNMDQSARFNSPNVLPKYPDEGGVSRGLATNYVRPPQQPPYHQQAPSYVNRGPIARNEAAPRIIPIAALNPYQGRWTIKARVTTKGEMRHYNNPRGDGKVFSFDLLDSEGGEIRVTCFNAVADQFYQQIEAGKVYMVSRGTLRPAQKAFNHLNNEHEIVLDNTSTVQHCFEEDNGSIPQQRFNFRPISDVEGLENNSVVDIIGIVSSISPSATIMRKNGTETQKRNLQLKDMSGRSVELTLWGSFCNGEGQALQNMCDSAVHPVLAVKSGRVTDFSGKSVGTFSSSQLFIEPDFPEAKELRMWFQNEGKVAPAISISRETTAAGGGLRPDARKTISQIKDEKLGTSEKPDWITVSATLTFVKMDNFCYMACPVMIGDRACNKKVVNNGDGKWRCERCDRLSDECDYRYILQMQIQDHTGLTWATAFQESGEEIMGGISAKDLYRLKYDEQDDEKLAEVVRGVLFTRFVFKLKVKEEMFSDEQRVKSTVVKAEKVGFKTETRHLLDSIAKLKGENPPTSSSITETAKSSGSNYSNQYERSGAPPPAAFMAPPNGSMTMMMMHCSSCGGTGHNNSNCPSSATVQSYGSGNGGMAPVGGGNVGSGGECFKCHQFGHWARDCPNAGNAPPYASSSRYGVAPKQHVGGF